MDQLARHDVPLRKQHGVARTPSIAVMPSHVLNCDCGVLLNAMVAAAHVQIPIMQRNYCIKP